MLRNKFRADPINEEVEVGGGATGTSKVPGPVATGDVHKNRSGDKDQGDKSPAKLKGETPGQSEEETDKETNVKPTGDNSAKNKASIDTKEEVDVELTDLFGEDLSEDFKLKTTALFNAALNERVDAIQTDLEEQYNKMLDEELEASREAMVESIDKYLSYAINEWVEENRLSIEASLRTEIAEEFMSNLKNLFAESYINVPDEQIDAIAEMNERIEELEQMYNEKTEEVMNLEAAINEAVASAIVEEVSEGLAVTQSEKLKTLVEGLSFEDPDTFKKKVQVVKESYFSKGDNKSPKVLQESFEADGGYDEVEMPTGPMSKYVRAISRTVKP